MTALAAAALAALIPVHGVVIQTLPDRSAIVRTEAIPAMRPAEIRRYRFDPPATFPPNTSIDGLLDGAGKPPSLRSAVAAGAFAPGLPDAGRVVPVMIGSRMPAAELVDQSGRLVRLESAFGRKTLLLSFAFTRCPDRTLCPAITEKFAYLQQRLDPARFAIVEITLDPQYDSPAILRAYAAEHGARGDNWALLTGTGSTITRVLDQFRISSMRVSTSNFLHDDRLFIVAPDGRIADIVETGSWDPESVLAQARSVSGLASNPFERLKLALVAEAIALCGGSQSAGIALLELSLFTLLTLFALLGLWAVARVLWRRTEA